MDEQRHKVKKDIARRIKVLHLIFIGVLAYFLIHIIVFIFMDKDMARAFEKMRNEYILDTTEVVAHRGSIYARNGEVLATSIRRVKVEIDFACDRFRKMGAKAYQQGANELAQALSDNLGDKSSNEYYKILMDNNKRLLKYTTNVEVKKRKKWLFFKEEKRDTTYSATIRKGPRSLRVFRDLDENEWEIIKNIPLLRKGKTYSHKPYDHRVYPQGPLAMRTIGRLEDHRTYGVEFAYKDTLAGHNGKQLTQRITNKYKMRVEHKGNIEAQDGYDVVTTLDVNVQDVVHTALSDQILAQKAFWGTTIVMECATGDILAMANLKNNGKECVEVQNYAIGVPVNPGSTFKLVSAMALLEDGVPASQKYYTELGQKKLIGNNTDAEVYDSHPIGEESEGIIDMRTAFAESSNVYFTKAVYERFKDKPVEFSDFCNKLHLGKTVGLEELGAVAKEVANLNRKHKSRYNALVNMAYGYGIEVTPLHTLAIYNAVANNGRMVAPRLILRTERNGEIINEAPVRVLDEQICSPKTLKTLRSFLAEVSKTGTAKKYFGPNACQFTSGSKTGTAQVESEINKVKHKRSDGYYYGSMVTYFPAENPRYTIITAIFTKDYKDKKFKYYGADLAGPVQKRVATYLYNRDHNHAQEISSAKYTASDIKGGNIEKIEQVAEKLNLSVSVDMNSGWGSSSTSKNKKRVDISPIEIEENLVPNVIGMGLSDAIFLLEKSGLEVEIKGRGKVTSQSLAPNSIIDNRKRRIIIILE